MNNVEFVKGYQEGILDIALEFHKAINIEYDNRYKKDKKRPSRSRIHKIITNVVMEVLKNEIN